MTEIQLRVLENWRRQASNAYLDELIVKDTLRHVVAGDYWTH